LMDSLLARSFRSMVKSLVLCEYLPLVGNISLTLRHSTKALPLNASFKAVKRRPEPGYFEALSANRSAIA
jgi:hypothetical protein